VDILEESARGLCKGIKRRKVVYLVTTMALNPNFRALARMNGMSSLGYSFITKSPLDGL
jgi:hypothetical protein